LLGLIGDEKTIVGKRKNWYYAGHETMIRVNAHFYQYDSELNDVKLGSFSSGSGYPKKQF